MTNFSASLNNLSRTFSVLPISRFANSGFNFRMDIKQIRRSNMLVLIEREKTNAAFARKVGTDPAYISQILSTKTKAEVGNDLARSIEAAYKLPHGWMDNTHDQPEAPAQGEHAELIAAWEYLLPGERHELLTRIKLLAAHNREAAAHFKPKVVRVTDMRKRQVRFDGPDHRHREDDSDAG